MTHQRQHNMNLGTGKMVSCVTRQKMNSQLALSDVLTVEKVHDFEKFWSNPNKLRCMVT